MKQKKAKGPAIRKETELPRALAWALVSAAVLFSAIIHIRLLHIPLERDEGEFAYMGQLILHGIPPYKLGYNMKMPGIYAAYALAMALFGKTIAGVHIGLLIVNAAAIVLVYLLALGYSVRRTGVAASLSYAVLSVSPSVLGTSAHATHYVVVFALLGILVLVKSLDSERRIPFFWSGLLLGLAFLMKQPGALFTVFAAVLSPVAPSQAAACFLVEDARETCASDNRGCHSVPC